MTKKRKFEILVNEGILDQRLGEVEVFPWSRSTPISTRCLHFSIEVYD